MKKVYVGIDLGSSCAVAVVDERGKCVERTRVRFSAENLRRYLLGLRRKTAAEVRIHLEETGLASYVYRQLRGVVSEVVVSDPKQNAWIAKSSQKSDPVDAGKLAELLRLGSYRPVYQPETEEMAEFKWAVQQYVHVRKRATSEKNRIKAMYRQQGMLIQGKKVYSEKGREEYLAELKSAVLRQMFQRRYRVLDLLEQEREGAARLVVSLGRRHPVVQRLQGVPGVGWLCAAVFVGYVQTPWRFPNKRDLWRYCRLGITDRTSEGKPLGRKRLDRSGNGMLKAISRTIFNAACRTKQENLFRRFYRASCGRSKDAVCARLNTQRKILTVLWTLWKKEEEYSDTPEAAHEVQRA